MARINSYQSDLNISANDKLIGTDAEANNRTKNFTISGLAGFFNRSGAINASNSLQYKYDTVNPGDSRSIGSISFRTEQGATVDFSTITELFISQTTLGSKNAEGFFRRVDQNIISIAKTDDPSSLGFYKVTSLEDDVDDNTFYILGLDFIDGAGSLEEDQDYFISFVQFDLEEPVDKTYEHDQAFPSATWAIPHGLGKFPSVTAVDTAGNVVTGSVEYVDNNNVIITFNAPFSGKAFLN